MRTVRQEVLQSKNSTRRARRQTLLAERLAPRLYMHCLHHSRGPSMSSQCLLLDNRSACMSIAQRLSVCLRVLPLACVL